MGDIQKKIEERAYQLFLERGKKPGHAMEDWIRAEKEVNGHKEKAQTSSRHEEKLVKSAFVMENKQQPKAAPKQDPNFAKKGSKNLQSFRA
jgi:Protein of unknown function (DUF2934)